MNGDTVKESGATGRPAEKYAGLQESTQTFGSIGLLEAVCGDLVLRGRHGERDHLYPLAAAVRRHAETKQMVLAMAKHGIRGWDTLKDIADEFRAKILEAVAYRRSHNMDIPGEALEFESRHYVQH